MNLLLTVNEPIVTISGQVAFGGEYMKFELCGAPLRSPSGGMEMQIFVLVNENGSDTLHQGACPMNPSEGTLKDTVLYPFQQIATCIAPFLNRMAYERRQKQLDLQLPVQDPEEMLALFSGTLTLGNLSLRYGSGGKPFWDRQPSVEDLIASLLHKCRLIGSKLVHDARRLAASNGMVWNTNLVGYYRAS